MRSPARQYGGRRPPYQVWRQSRGPAVQGPVGGGPRSCWERRNPYRRYREIILPDVLSEGGARGRAPSLKRRDILPACIGLHYGGRKGYLVGAAVLGRSSNVTGLPACMPACDSADSGPESGAYEEYRQDEVEREDHLWTDPNAREKTPQFKLG
jgi:hypothetical protein